MNATAKSTPLKLKALLKRTGIKQAALARAVRVSPGTLADVLNRGYRPVTVWPQLKASIEAQLRLAGASAAAIATAFDHRASPLKPQAKPKTQNAQSVPTKTSSERFTRPTKGVPQEGDSMLLRKQTLTPATRKHFGLFRDPFLDDVTCAEDIYLTPDMRYVREAMWATAKHGGLLAVVGESGAGKTTLRRDLIDRIAREQASMIVVEPYVLAMEESDTKGKTLKSAHIAEAIITTVNPLERPKRSPEARFRQLHQLLKDSHRSGNKHVLVIEEAHCLPTATLKHLKRFFELEDGFKKLLSIILIGQPELRTKLSDKNAEVREVVQRCELVELAPLDNHLGDYLKFKLSRVGCDFDKVFEAGAVDALRAKLTFSSKPHGQRGQGASQTTSLLYPLAVANVVSAAMNMALSIGAPALSADVIKEI